MANNTDNERALIGAVMRDPAGFDGLADIVNGADFHWHCYGWAWRAMKSLHERGMSIDTITVGDELDRSGHLADFMLDHDKSFTGRQALAKAREEGNPRAAETYAAKVLDYSAKRQGLEILNKGAAWFQNGRTAHDSINDLVSQLSDLRTFDSKSAKHTQKLGEAVSAAYDHTDAAARGDIDFVMTGYKDLDDMLGGMAAPDVLVIAARPGQGKTAFLASVAKNAASKGKHIAIFSLEMKNSQIAMRLIAMESGVSYDKQKTGKLLETDWQKYTNAVETLSNFDAYPITLNDMPSIKPSQIRRELRRIAKVDLVIVDYVQLADADGKYDMRSLEVSSVMKGLKAIAKEFDVPILTAAQLSRAVEARQEKRPVLSDLKESGGIEENADVVMFIYRPDQYEKDTDKQNTAEIIVSKHRNGQVGSVELIYRPSLTRFESAAARRFTVNE